MKYYAAYGSNLQAEQMKKRCPSAIYVGAGVIEGYRLVFWTFATIEPAVGHATPVGVYRLNEVDEANLDGFEGVRINPPSYIKENINVKMDSGEVIECMVYIKKRFCRMDYPNLPDDEYYKRIKKGYKEKDLDTKVLKEAYEYTEELIKKFK
ncbi:MAG TPA: gamma-glutamylcyclotransferase [Clostridia bacterium]|jgi:hypothetical protein|nr:gamma-glutamylcyclotransferase [Clostridia bacterium]